MKKISKYQSGFSAVDGLLLLVIIGVIGFIGWYVYHAQQNANKNYTQTSRGNPIFKKTTKKKVTTAPYAGWTTYNSKDGKISLKYPKTWVTAAHPELCGEGVLLLGANSSSVGTCGSEGFGQITVTWQPSHANCGNLDGSEWAVNSKKTVLVSGVSGLKQTATSKAISGQGLGDQPAGIPAVNYCFNIGGYTYVANYTKLAAYPDVLDDFNLMVTQTLKFGN